MTTVIDHAEAPDAAVLAAFDLAPGSLEAATSGLINKTWCVRSAADEPLVLQRINPIFPPGTNRDIDTVTRHLQSKGLVTPRLVPTRTGALWLEHEGAVWRVSTFIEGLIHESTVSGARAAEAGRMLAEFHRALDDLDYTFENARLGVHDTTRHLENLRVAVEQRTQHARHARIARLASDLDRLSTGLAPLDTAPDRIVHGDPKLENIMFDPSGRRALCMIDLDTLTKMPVAIELGDALRSWCNPAAEDARDAGFSIALFEAAVTAYAAASRGLLLEPEWRSIPEATLTIAVELAARFCADALHEQYFAWDRQRYRSASEHNEARTRGQLAVAAGIKRERERMDAILEQAFGT